ncbi:FAD-dependent oxidoreductase [Nocardia sp. R16R-3T]
MVHVITQPCCNDAACVAVCPVGCIHPTPDEPGYATAEMLYVDGGACIDCGACVDVCPVGAIVPEDELTPATQRYVEINALHFDENQYLSQPPRGRQPVTIAAEAAPLRVAIVGSGPAASYAAEELLSHRGLAVEVTMFERLLTPWGLVRFGVAPDHPETKAVTAGFERTARRSALTLHLGVEVGTHLTHEELLAHHHAVIYAVGMSTDRPLGIPGEDLPGSAAATDFVGWYNGHPDYANLSFDLSSERVVVVGNGNVALDVARILTADVDQLRRTDIADHALDVLADSAVREVVVLGRRGPTQAAYTTPELLALGDLPGVDVVARPAEVVLDPLSEAGLDALTEFKVRIVQEYAERQPTGGRRISLRYLLAPQSLLGTDRVEGLRAVRTELVRSDQGTLDARVTTVIEDLECGLVLRAIGYRGKPVAGMPFNDDDGIIRNDQGRVVDPDSGLAVAGTYVAGWIKRGASGGIGTNKKCAADTVAQVLADHAAGLLAAPSASADDLEVLLRTRRPGLPGYAGWEAIDLYERLAGQARDRPRVKVTDTSRLLKIAQTVPQGVEHPNDP